MSGRSAWLRRKPETFWVQMSGLIAASWGLYVLLEDVPMRQMPVYDEFVQFIPAWAWARIAIVLGVAQAGCALAALRWSFMLGWPRRLTGLPVMLFWKVMGVSMLNSGEAAPAAVVLCGLGVLNIPVVFLPLLRPR